MSSMYHVLCMSHDPAALIVEFNTAAEAQSALTQGFEWHPECDLLLSRVSGAPIEFACPGIVSSPGAEQPACQGYHNSIEWVDANWLRLLVQARQIEQDNPSKLMDSNTFKCWTPERLTRLRFQLEGRFHG